MKQQIKAFTLIELIIVITILSILSTIGFISFNGYTKDARDTNRLTSLKILRDGLFSYKTQQSILPLPDDNIILTSSGINIFYQGYLGKGALSTIKAIDTKDPLNQSYYTYMIDSKKKNFQLLGYLENDTNVIALNPDSMESGFLEQTYALDYSNRYITTVGDELGILVQSGTNIPLQELKSASFTGVDIINTMTGYTAILSNIEKLTGTGDILRAINPDHIKEWVSTLGGTGVDNSNAILRDNLGNIYVRGTYTGPATDFAGGILSVKGGSTDGYIAKLDNEGNQLWIKTIGGTTGVDNVFSIVVDKLGNIYVGGTYTGPATDFTGGILSAKGGVTDGYIAKLDNEGNQLWIKTIGGASKDYQYGINLDPLGNIYLRGAYAGPVIDFAGGTLVAKGGSIDGYIAKLDNNGNQLWIKTIGGTSNDYQHSINLDKLGNIYVGGQYIGPATDFAGGTLAIKGLSTDGYIAKLDNNGNQSWIKTIGGTGSDSLASINVDNLGNIYVGGTYTGPATDFAGGILSAKGGANDRYIAKLDNNGNQLLIKTLGGTLADNVFSIVLDSLGNIYVRGVYTGPAIDFVGGTLIAKGLSTDGYIAKLDNNGDQSWIKTIGGTETDFVRYIDIDIRGVIYIIGGYKNDNIDTNRVLDFKDNTLFGKSTDSTNQDRFIQKLYLNN